MTFLTAAESPPIGPIARLSPRTAEAVPSHAVAGEVLRPCHEVRSSADGQYVAFNESRDPICIGRSWLHREKVPNGSMWTWLLAPHS